MRSIRRDGIRQQDLRFSQWVHLHGLATILGIVYRNHRFTRVASIAKFSYLRELLDPKVKLKLEALPFTSEEYNHAKSILTEKYGEESEIVKAYTREILDIPSVPNANSKKISEFSESTSLAFKIQFHLETEKIGVILRSKPGHQTFSALYSTDNRCTTSSRATKSCIDANPKSARPPTSGAAMMASSS